MIGNKRLGKLVEKINNLKPDIVLIAGDIIDDNLLMVKQKDLFKNFNNIKSTYGVFAVVGNHEYIGAAYQDWDYYAKNNIQLLKDTAIMIDDSFYLVGREDIQISRHTSKQRKTIQKVFQAAL